MKCRPFCAIVLTMLASAASAGAQGALPQPEKGRYPLGDYVSATPAVVMVGGYDTNFARTNIGAAAREFYVSPQLQAFLGKGRTRLSGTGAVEVQRVTNGNTVNNYVSADGQTGTDMLGVQAAFIRRDHYAPPTDFVGFEIGIRSRRVEHEYRGSVTVAPGRARLSTAVEHFRLRYDADQVYEGSSLHDNLNRNTTWLSGTADVAITPFTAVTGSVAHVDDSFLYAPYRDGSGWRALAGVALSRRAVVSGFAQLGVLNYQSKLTRVKYSGPAHLVDLQFARRAVFLDLQANREIRFSFDPTRGFYLSNGFDAFGTLTLRRRIETFLRASTRRLTPEGPGKLLEQARNVWLVKGGAAYRLSSFTRFGVEVEHYNYDENTPGGFVGTRYIAFMIWGPDNLVRLDRPLPGQF